jgi:Arc/MetJ-type ribon-helix-helix transcriptional regulator
VPAPRRKAKVSLTLPPEMVSALDDAVADGRYASRSDAMAGALAGWVREERRRRRDAEIDAYYDGATAPEVEEDRDWAALGQSSLGRDAVHRERSGSGGSVGSGRKRKRARKNPLRSA